MGARLTESAPLLRFKNEVAFAIQGVPSLQDLCLHGLSKYNNFAKSKQEILSDNNMHIANFGKSVHFLIPKDYVTLFGLSVQIDMADHYSRRGSHYRQSECSKHLEVDSGSSYGLVGVSWLERLKENRPISLIWGDTLDSFEMHFFSSTPFTSVALVSILQKALFESRYRETMFSKKRKSMVCELRIEMNSALRITRNVAFWDRIFEPLNQTLKYPHYFVLDSIENLIDEIITVIDNELKTHRQIFMTFFSNWLKTSSPENKHHKYFRQGPGNNMSPFDTIPHYIFAELMNAIYRVSGSNG